MNLRRRVLSPVVLVAFLCVINVNDVRGQTGKQTGNKLRKCCPLDAYIHQNQSCVPLNDTNTNDEFDQLVRSLLNRSVADYKVVFGSACTSDAATPLLYIAGAEPVKLTEEGSLRVDEVDDVFDTRSYCLDVYDGKLLLAVVCQSTAEKPVNPIQIGMMVSLPFLFVTLVVYIITWENTIQKNCQMAYVFSLMSAYFYLVYIQQNSTLENTPCIVLASFCLYFFMASFCWMNILCIDMYCTFSGMRGYNTFKRSSQWKRFTMYLIYAFGAPSILLGLIFVLNKSENLKAWYHPLFGEGQCWLGHGYPVLLYFNGPMGALLFANIVLFVLTAWKIYQINRDTKMLRSRESQKHYDSNKQQFKVYVKLLLAMGINWILEFISWLVDWILGSKRVPEVWIVTDFCNALYGVFIFLLFVCKKPVWIKIKQRYYTWMGKPNTARALSARTSTPNQTSMTYETTMA